MGLDIDGVDGMKPGRVAFCFPGQGSLEVGMGREVATTDPWLVMQPSFGLGIAASKAPKPTQARLKSLMTHTVFGIGLYLWGLLLSPLLFR